MMKKKYQPMLAGSFVLLSSLILPLQSHASEVEASINGNAMTLDVQGEYVAYHLSISGPDTNLNETSGSNPITTTLVDDNDLLFADGLYHWEIACTTA